MNVWYSAKVFVEYVCLKSNQVKFLLRLPTEAKKLHFPHYTTKAEGLWPLTAANWREGLAEDTSLSENKWRMSSMKNISQASGNTCAFHTAELGVIQWPGWQRQGCSTTTCSCVFLNSCTKVTLCLLRFSDITNSKPACVSSYHHLPVLGISNNHSVADIAEGNQMLPLFWQLL